MIFTGGLKPITLYWQDGRREVISARYTDVETCVNVIIHRNRATRTLDLWSAGVTDDYFFGKDSTWVRRMPIRTTLFPIPKVDWIREALQARRNIVVDLPNKNQVCIDIIIGEYPVSTWVKCPHGEVRQTGWARSIRVYVAEFQDGPYDWKNETEKCHYLVNFTSHWRPDDNGIDQAVNYFRELLLAFDQADENGLIAIPALGDLLRSSEHHGAVSIERLIRNQTCEQL